MKPANQPVSEVLKFKTAELDHRYQEWFLTDQEFAAALRQAATEEHYPWLYLLADDIEDPKHTGGNIYEGVRICGRVIDFTGEKPVLKISMESPCWYQLPHNRIRWFAMRSVRFWNLGHTPQPFPMREDPSAWLTGALKSFQEAIGHNQTPEQLKK